MIPKAVRDFQMPFGKHRGKTLDEITNCGLDHEGLRYLDWCIGAIWVKESHHPTFEAIRQYLKDPDMARSLELALEDS